MAGLPNAGPLQMLEEGELTNKISLKWPPLLAGAKGTRGAEAVAHGDPTPLQMVWWRDLGLLQLLLGISKHCT